LLWGRGLIVLATYLSYTLPKIQLTDNLGDLVVNISGVFFIKLKTRNQTVTLSFPFCNTGKLPLRCKIKGMKQLRKFIERVIEGLLTLSGGITSLVILLIIIFLFKEGAGLFSSPSVEKGYTLCINAQNTIENLSPSQIKQIFDWEITNWREVGGADM
jgi:hypothetical protein